MCRLVDLSTPTRPSLYLASSLVWLAALAIVSVASTLILAILVFVDTVCTTIIIKNFIFYCPSTWWIKLQLAPAKPSLVRKSEKISIHCKKNFKAKNIVYVPEAFLGLNGTRCTLILAILVGTRYLSNALIYLISVGDPWHFGADPDPDPWIRTSY